MKVKCSSCNKNFDNDIYHGICPKCGAFNRITTATQEHQAYHNMYDNGYDHSEHANHQAHHDRYDNGYNHSEHANHQAHHDRYDNGYTHNEPHNRQKANNDVERYSPYRNQPDRAQQKRKMPLVLKIIIILFFINIVGPIIYFILWSLGYFLTISY